MTRPSAPKRKRTSQPCWRRRTLSRHRLPRRPHWHVGLTTGYDDNLLGSSDLIQFELTLVDGRLPVETDPDQRPQAGGFVRADLRYNADLVTSPTALWRTSVVASQRSSPQTSLARQGHAGGNAQRAPLF